MVQNLQFLRSLTAGVKPPQLAQGQIAFNLADKILFVGDGTDTITYLDGTTAAAPATGAGYFESDLDISTAVDSANGYTDQKIADLVDTAPALLNTLNELAAAIGDDENFVTTVTNSVATVQTNLDTESARAQAAEISLGGQIASESVRAQAAEGVLTADLAAEVARATAAEGALAADLASEVSRAVAAEGALAADLASEVSRAQAAEGVLTSDLAAEAARALAAEGVLAADLATETSRAQAAEGVLTADLASEISRATAAEASVQAAANAAVNAEAARAQSAEASLSARIASIENGIDLGVF